MLHEKVALVTGAAAGIGEGIAALFAAQGAHVLLLDRDAAQNEAAASAIRAQGGSAARCPYGCHGPPLGRCRR